MVRLRRVEQPTSIYRDAYVEVLVHRRARWASVKHGVGHRHGSRSMVASIESLDSERPCLTCGAARRVELIDRRLADVEAGRPVVDDGSAFGIPQSGGQLYALEADGTVTRVTVVHIDETVHYQRPDGSLIHTERSHGRG